MIKRMLRSGNLPILGERKIHLHLGAHKTATTFLQRNLAQNRETLLENGILYLPLSETRKKISKNIRNVSRESRDNSTLTDCRVALLDGFGRENLERCHTILISDENLTGGAMKFKKGIIYKTIQSDWKHVHEELGPNITVSFSIRDYPSFFTSIYAELLRNNHHFPIRKMVKLFGKAPSLWTNVYRGLAGSFGSENVTIWDFKDTISHPGKVMSMLTGAEMPFEITSAPVRESLSGKAINFLRDFQKLPGPRLPAATVSEVARRLYPSGETNAKFDPWKDRERASLMASYEKEKENIPVRKF